jgi:thymidine kinase
MVFHQSVIAPTTLHAKKIKKSSAFFKRLQAKKGVRTCFTDAVLVDENLFLGYSRKHAYDEILGSLIGRIDIETMKIDFTKN